MPVYKKNKMFNKNLYNTKFHQVELNEKSFLITGGAGFIGSNLAEYLLRYNAKKVIVIDNLSNGYLNNIEHFLNLPNFEFINGDIRDVNLCRNIIKKVDYVSHQAALGSVPRSIKDPMTTHDNNVNGFLTLLDLVRNSENIKMFVYAASSSTYGDSLELPKNEGREGKPLSPYAVTKLINELYAEIYSKVYSLHTIGLRYFNVFGPKQNPNNPYAAVIPIFCKSFINDNPIYINGDGQTTRDFTFIENVVQANIKALLFEKLDKHEVFNVACGDSVSLNNIVDSLHKITNKNIKITNLPDRIGDIKHSLANINKIQTILNYTPHTKFNEGLELVYNWYISNEETL